MPQQLSPPLVPAALPFSKFTPGFLSLTVADDMRSLIWRAIVKKACSTFCAFLAEVSTKGIPRLSANSYYLFISTKHESSPWACPHLCHRIIDDLLVCHIALVADEELVDTFGCIAVDLLQPLLDVVEALHVCHVVNDADAVCAAVVGGGDCAEALLACGVPLCDGVSAIVLHYCLPTLVHHRDQRTICSFTFLPSISTVLIFCRCCQRLVCHCPRRAELTKSTPMVEM